MLGDLFGDEEDGEFGLEDSGQAAAVQANVQPWSYKNRPAHCASNIDMPAMVRQESNLCGLVNQ